VTVGPDPKARKKGRFNATTRFAIATAERHLDVDAETPWELDPPEFDDAPRDEDVPPDYHDDEDDGLYDDGRDLRAPTSSWIPWVRLSIFWRDGRLDYRTELPDTDSPGVGRSQFYLRRNWTTTAQTLISTQEEALRRTTPLAALHALGPYAMKDLEQSDGQGTRDRRVVIRTPFGLAPLWFFAQGRSDGLFNDLERIGRAVMKSRPKSLSKEMITETVRHPSLLPDTIIRVRGKTLIALSQHPDVLAKHRSLWPLTTPRDLLDDLGLESDESRLGRAGDVAVLALAGAFDPPDLLLAASARREPKREIES
jgi:hypothetical protein